MDNGHITTASPRSGITEGTPPQIRKNAFTIAYSVTATRRLRRIGGLADPPGYRQSVRRRCRASLPPGKPVHPADGRADATDRHGRRPADASVRPDRLPAALWRRGRRLRRGPQLSVPGRPSRPCKASAQPLWNSSASSFSSKPPIPPSSTPPSAATPASSAYRLPWPPLLRPAGPHLLARRLPERDHRVPARSRREDSIFPICRARRTQSRPPILDFLRKPIVVGALGHHARCVPVPVRRPALLRSRAGDADRHPFRLHHRPRADKRALAIAATAPL